MPTDYYSTLGVSRTASEKEIRSAYRKLARKLHPDVNPNDKASESRFKDVNAAYDVLSDADKRKKYDRHGDNWEHADEIERQQRESRNRGGGFYYNSRPNGGGGFRDLNIEMDGEGDILGELFGRRRRPRNLNVEQPIQVSLEEAVTGTSRTLLTGGMDGGESKRIEVKIPAGVMSGSRVRVANEGMEEGGRKGDLFLVIDVRASDRFERKGDDLYVDAEAPLTTAVLGGEAEVQAVGRKVALKLPPLTQNGRVFRLAGLGVPHLNGSGKGDLYAKILVRLPETLGDEERQLFEELKDKGL